MCEIIAFLFFRYEFLAHSLTSIAFGHIKACLCLMPATEESRNLFSFITGVYIVELYYDACKQKIDMGKKDRGEKEREPCVN